MKLVYKIIIFLSIISSIFILLYFSVLKKEFIIENLEEDKIVEILDYNSKYKETKINAKYGNKVLGYKKVGNIKKITKKEIDTTKLKEYKIKYELKYNGHKKIITKVIEVVDNEKPEIEVENDTINMCPNSDKYNLKYKVIDNYDGDITDKAKENRIDDKIVIEVFDSSSNYNKKEIHVEYKDIEKPKIKLNGNSSISLMVGETYLEKLATATDDCDGDITKNIKITSNVDTKKAGIYEVKYSVKDYNGNEAVTSRKVVVYPKNNPSSGGKIIYLTFDDGPYVYTEKLLQILKKYNVKATFFVTNQYPGYRSLIKKEYEDGHAIGIHSYTHNYSNIYSSLDNYVKDLNKMSDIIKKETGLDVKLVRLPGGSSNTISKKYKKGIMTEIVAYLDNNGYHYYDWNVSSGDAGETTSTSKVVDNVTKYMNGNNLIVLQHDIKGFSVDAVEQIIVKGLSKGYSFQKLDENSFTAHQKIAN